MRRSAHSAGAALAAASLAACLYVPPTNERPRARIEEQTQGPYGVNEPIRLSADKTTDDNAAVTLRASWQARACDESGQDCELLAVSAEGTGIFSTILITPTRKGEIQVQLTVTDGHGAAETVDHRLPVVNRDPTVQAQVRGFPDPGPSGGHVLGLPVEVAVSAADPDGDPVELAWEVFPPLGGGSNPDDVTFRPVDESGTVYELIGDVPGLWEVHVAATDGDGGSAQVTESLVLAPDGPPCIAGTAPATTGTETVILDEPTRFAVLRAADALDPHPPLADAHELVERTRFSWSLASPATGGALTELSGHDLAELILDPDRYAPGDHLELRVEIADRVARTLPCAADEPVCSIGGDGCLQRLTWEVEVR